MRVMSALTKVGTPNIRVDRFLRFAVRFRLVLFAFRLLAMDRP
jgi:hypothetical protein